MARRVRERGFTRAAARPDDRTGAYGDDIPPGLLRPRNGAGRAAMVCGILALLCAIGFFLLVTVPLAIVLGLAAILLGVMGRSRFRRGTATNPGAATTGIVTGLLALLILGGLAVGGVALFNHNKDNPTFKSFQQCSQAAGSDAQKQKDCADQFKNSITQ